MEDALRLVLAIWRYFPCHCHDFRFYVTLFPKCFSNFRSRYLFDIGLPTLYLTLADIYLPLDTSLPRSATLLVRIMWCSGFWLNGLTPSMAQYSHEGLCSAGFALHIEFRQSRTNHDTTFVPQLKAYERPIRHWVRSFFARRWLKESRLFSFPPLSNMLKFSG